jgi:hypothetical protein
MEEERKAKECAVATLINIWNCIDWNKVDSKRAYNIWDEFTNKVKAASYTTNKYERFVEKLCKKLNINSLKFREIIDIEMQNINLKNQIMELFREETLSLVLEVKLNKEIIKEQKKLEKNREEDKGED